MKVQLDSKYLNRVLSTLVFGLIAMWAMFYQVAMLHPVWMLVCVFSLYFMFKESRGN